MIQNLSMHKLIMRNHEDTKGTKRNEHASSLIRAKQKNKNCGKLLFFLFITFIISLLPSAVLFAEGPLEKNDIPATQKSEEEAWTGIDVSIVGKYAAKYGHPPRDPYINTDQGDLLLFVFTVAGVIGGDRKSVV